MDIHDLRGHRLGQYQLRELLGVGGMGAVYRAEQSALRRAVAVKVMSAQLTTEPGYVERFYREARIAAQLEHAHIIPVYDYGVQGDISYLVMRLLTGASLMDRLRQSAEHRLGLPTLPEISEVLSQLASALDYAHSQGVIHRDIKPNNVMFDNQGSAYLVDFGIAKLLEATSVITNSGVAMGTPLFMPPEQWRSEEISPAADQYALGVMLYLLMTGQAPFQSNTPHGLMYKHLNEMPTPPQALRADVPQAVTIVLERALAKEPTKRFPTVTALAQSFSSAIAGVDSERTNFFIAPVRPTRPAAAMTAAPTSREAHAAAPEASAPPARKRQTGWLLGLVGVLLVAALAFVVIRSQQQPVSGGLPVAGLGSTPTEGATAAATANVQEPTQALPTTAAATATAEPSAATSPSATSVPPTVTSAPPSVTPVPPSATAQPTKPPVMAPARSMTAVARLMMTIAPTLTAQSWTDTPMPTPTGQPSSTPTVTPPPPTATSLPPTPTLLPPTPTRLVPTGTRPPPSATPYPPTPTPLTVAIVGAEFITPENAALLVERASADAAFSPLDLALSADGSRVAIGGNGVAIYDSQTMALLSETRRGGHMALSADWALLATVDDTRVVFSNPSTGAEVGAIDILTSISSIAISPDGLIAVAATGKVVKILDVASRQILKTINIDTTMYISAIAFTPDGSALVVASDAGIEVLNAQNWTQEIGLTSERSSAIAISPDGLKVAAQQDGQIMVWELPTGRQLVSLAADGRALAFSPDGRLLATGGAEPVVTIWDLETRRALASLTGHTGAIERLAFAPDGTTLVSASADATIKAWALAAP